VKNWLKRVSIFYRYYISYLVLLLVPFIVVGVFVFDNSVNSLNAEIRSMYTYKLNQAANDIEAQFYTMSHIAYDISQSRYFKPSFLNENSYNSIEMLEDFNKYMGHSQIVDDMIYYFKGSRDMYSLDGKYYFDAYMERILEKPQIDELYKKINDTDVPLTLTFKTIDNSHTIFYIYPISTVNSSMPTMNASVVFIVNQASLWERVQRVAGELEGDIFLFSGKQPLAFSTEDKNVTAFAMKEIDKNISPNKIGISEYQGTTIMSIASTKGHYNIVLILSSIKFSETVNRLKNINWIILLMLAVLCLLLGAAFAYGNYRPIKLLEMTMKNWRPYNNSAYDSNEIENISTVFKTAKLNNDLLEYQVNEQKILIRHQTLTMLLNGSYNSLVANRMKTLDIHLSGPYYCVMTVRSKQKGINNAHACNDHIIEAINELQSTYGEIYAVEHSYDNCVAVLCSLSDDKYNTRQNIADQIISVCEEKSLVISVCVGCAYNSVHKLKVSFLEALSLVENQELKAEGVVFFEKIDKSFMQLLRYPSDEMVYVIQSIRIGNNQTAKDSFEEFLEKTKRNVPSLLMQRCICFEIINSLAKAARDLKVELLSSEISPVVTFDNLEDFKVNINLLIDKICCEVLEKAQKRNNERAGAVVQYINEHFLDYDMSLKKLSEIFDLSINHLSRIIKENTGDVFQVYLIGLRIAEAKKLLILGELSVNEISNIIGYANVSHFIKIFKSYVGITPAKYKGSVI